MRRKGQIRLTLSTYGRVDLEGPRWAALQRETTPKKSLNEAGKKIFFSNHLLQDTRLSLVAPGACIEVQMLVSAHPITWISLTCWSNILISGSAKCVIRTGFSIKNETSKCGRSVCSCGEIIVRLGETDITSSLRLLTAAEAVSEYSAGESAMFSARLGMLERGVASPHTVL